MIILYLFVDYSVQNKITKRTKNKAEKVLLIYLIPHSADIQQVNNPTSERSSKRNSSKSSNNDIINIQKHYRINRINPHIRVKEKLCSKWLRTARIILIIILANNLTIILIIII